MPLPYFGALRRHRCHTTRGRTQQKRHSEEERSASTQREVHKGGGKTGTAEGRGGTDHTMAMEAGGGESQGHRKKGVRLGLKRKQQNEEGIEGKQRRRRGGGGRNRGGDCEEGRTSKRQ